MWIRQTQSFKEIRRKFKHFCMQCNTSVLISWVRKGVMLLLLCSSLALTSASFEVFTAVRMRIPFFWDKKLRQWVIGCRCIDWPQWLVTLELEVTAFLRNVENRLPIAAASYPRRLESLGLCLLYMTIKMTGTLWKSWITHADKRKLLPRNPQSTACRFK